MSDDVVYVPQGDEPDGEWYPEEPWDDYDYDDDIVEFPIPDGDKCSHCDHFISDMDDEHVILHEGLPYCEDCYDELGLYPSEDLDNWTEVFDEE